MQATRRLLAQRLPVALLLAATLILKLLIPAGYMIDSVGGRVTVTLCSGVAPQKMAMAMPGMHGEMAGRHKSDHGKPEMPCAFAGLAAAALGAVDPIQTAIFIAFIMATGLGVIAIPSLHRQANLRPPLRGPPLIL